MSRQSRSAMAGSLDLSRGLRITLILNLVLAGFYYAFAGEDAAAVSGTVLGFSTLFTLIAHCGLPFAEAAFVSLFIRKKDYRSVLYVRMVSGMFAIGITVFVCIVLALCAGPLALVILGGEAPAADPPGYRIFQRRLRLRPRSTRRPCAEDPGDLPRIGHDAGPCQ